MGSVTAILVNIPGKNSNAATTIDGYPLTQQGHARTAIGCAAAASALGSTFGVLVLIALIPVMRAAVLAFGSLEMLLLVVWGLTTVAVVTAGAPVKGLSLAALGVLIGLVGHDPRTAELRYTFGTFYLQDGFALVPVFLGIFAVTEMITLAVSKRKTISGMRSVHDLTGSAWTGVRAVFRHFNLFLRSSVLGTVIGMIPGVGGTVASFVAYGQAARSGRGGSGRFGHGDIRGVIAPEAANDAKDGGALVPTLAFGVPGGTGTAMLLVVLTLHGITPGRELISSQLTLVFVLVWSLFISNWLSSLIGLAAVNPLTRITVVRTHLLVPVVLGLVAMAAFVYKGQAVENALKLKTLLLEGKPDGTG